MSEETLYRKALGRAAELGRLYNARKEEFCNESLFKINIPENLITSTDVPNVTIEYDFSKTYGEQFNKLGVDAELKCSVLAGLLRLEGSGKYFSNEKTSFKSVRGSLIYEIHTKEEHISISNENLKPLICYESLKKEATHVVVGIKWGASAIASFEYSSKENSEKKNIEGCLKAILKEVGSSIKGSTSAEFSEDEKKLRQDFSIRFVGDVVPANEEVPQSYESALELIRKIPKYAHEFNSGKGKAIEYTLYPLKQAESFYGLESTADRLLNSLNFGIITKIEKEFDNWLLKKQKLNDLKDDLNKFHACIHDRYIEEVSSKLEKVTHKETEFRKAISNELILIRSGKRDESDIEDLINEIHNDNCSKEEIENFIQSYSWLIRKIERIKVYTKRKIIYITKNDSIEDLELHHDNKDLYLFFYNEELRKDENFDKSLNFFLTIAREDEQESTFMIVDYDIHPKLDTSQGVKIHFYSNGKLIDDDFYESKKERINWCIAKSINSSISMRTPNETACIEFPCPGMKSNCPRDTHIWVCYKCEQEIEYGFDNAFYCECGGSSVENYKFKCNSPRHPNAYLPLDMEEFSCFFHESDSEEEEGSEEECEGEGSQEDGEDDEGEDENEENEEK